MHQILAILFNLITVISYTIKSYTNHQTAFKSNAKTSMITKLLLIVHLLGHLIAWVIIRLCLNEFIYLSIALTVLIYLSAVKFGSLNCSKTERQIWIEPHRSSQPKHLTLIDLLSCWISPAIFLSNNSSKLFFNDVSTLQRKIMLIFTLMATALLQLSHLTLIALLLNMTNVFEAR
jgi:hypothetical protein